MAGARRSVCAAALLLCVMLASVSAVEYTLGTIVTIGAREDNPFRRAPSAMSYRTGEMSLWGGIDNVQVTSNILWDLDMSVVPPSWTAVTENVPLNGRTKGPYIQTGDLVWSYGGLDLGAKTSDIYRIDTVANTFSLPTFANNFLTNETLDPNHCVLNTLGAAAAYDSVENQMYLFGGLTDAAMLNLPTKVSLSNLSCDTFTAEDKSNRPSRRFASALLFRRSGATRQLLVFGGVRQLSDTEAPVMLGDTYSFDLSTQAWTTVSYSGLVKGTDYPAERCWASTTRLPNGTGTVLYGGIYMNSTSTIAVYNDFWVKFDNQTNLGRWVRITLTNPSENPVGRGEVGQAYVNNLGEEGILYFGGQLAGQTTDNLLFELVFTDCPYGAGNCFGPTPGNETTTTTSTTGTTTTGTTTTGTTITATPLGVTPPIDSSSAASDVLVSDALLTMLLDAAF